MGASQNEIEKVENGIENNIGALDESSEQLEEELIHDGDIDQEEAGEWITTIGKAILAIFKP